jgi:hypothetical protein
MADTKLTALAELTTLTVDDLLYAVDDPATTPASKKITMARMRDFVGMEYAALTIDTANVNGVINTLQYATIAGLTADRTWTLPATAAVGDRCGLWIADGDTAFEVLITAATGDTLNAIAGGTEWSRLFIVNEFVICRCVVANATWIVEYDGRIPQKGVMRLSTSADGESAATYTRPTQAATPGAWTAAVDVGSVCSTTGDSIKSRRAANVLLTFTGVNLDGITDQNYSGSALFLSGAVTAIISNTLTAAFTGVAIKSIGAIVYPFAIDDYALFQYRNQEAGKGLLGGTTYVTHFSLTELLP